jgi:hypothetical protein
MSTILVEDRVCTMARPALDAIAKTCRRLGHDVFRWRGPYSGRVPHWRYIFPCDLAVLFNGAHTKYDQPLAKLRRMNAKLLFVEIGWNPQRGTCQIDPSGINAMASWAQEPLEVEGKTPLQVGSSGDLLVVLQLDRDSQITRLSPWFRSMAEFVGFVCRHSQLPVRIRKHPKAKPDPALEELVNSLGAAWDNSPTLAAALEDCRAVACINSSCGVEALEHRLPVLCYGRAIYRHPSAVYCLTDDPRLTIEATAEIAAGKCSLMAEQAQAALARIMVHQWPHAEIPDRLPVLLEEVLADAPPKPLPSRRWLLSGARRACEAAAFAWGAW